MGEQLAGFETRRVVRIHSDQGDYVVKSEPMPRADVRDEDQLLVLDFVADSGYGHAPSVLLTRRGQRVARTVDGLTVILEFVPQTLDENSWAALGHAAAKLNALQDFAIPFAIPIVDAISDLAVQAAGHSFEAQFSRLLDRVFPLAGDSRHGIIHGEINLANARRTNDGTVVLLDWDQAGTAPTALEWRRVIGQSAFCWRDRKCPGASPWATQTTRPGRGRRRR